MKLLECLNIQDKYITINFQYMTGMEEEFDFNGIFRHTAIFMLGEEEKWFTVKNRKHSIEAALGHRKIQRVE